MLGFVTPAATIVEIVDSARTHFVKVAMMVVMISMVVNVMQSCD